jgi:hypothetical protein
MVAIMLIGGLAILLAIGLGALVAPSTHPATADPYTGPWQSLGLSLY